MLLGRLELRLVVAKASLKWLLILAGAFTMNLSECFNPKNPRFTINATYIIGRRYSWMLEKLMDIHSFCMIINGYPRRISHGARTVRSGEAVINGNTEEITCKVYF